MKLLGALLAIALPAAAQERRDPRVEKIVARIDAAQLQQTVTKLVSFGTRLTISDPNDPARGIGAARKWLAGEFAAAADRPGSRLRTFEDRFTAPPGKRIPEPVEIVNLGVILTGTDPARAKQAVVMTGHYDSMPTDILDKKADAPGADDDGSGVSMALALANAFAAESPAITLYFIAVAGEEQGLVGSQHLAQRLKAEGIDVLAMVSVDIAGNSEGQDGVRDSTTGRLFSEGAPELESEAQKKWRLASGNENDSPAREWARYVRRVGELYSSGLRLRVMLRRDRIARGSDHMSFAHEGFPAIRLSEAKENYHRQHQTPRVENGVQFGDDLAHFDALYAARLCRALGGAIGAIGFAPAPPRDVSFASSNTPDGKLRWTLPADVRIHGVVLYRRPADQVAWEKIVSLGKVSEVVMPSVNVDDWFFAVSTADEAGNESLPQAPSAMARP